MANVAMMSSSEKAAEAIRRSLPLLPSDARNQVVALLQPDSIAIVSGTLLLWGGSHLFGIGEIVDIILLVVGFGMLGASVVAGARELSDFVTATVGAQAESDLDRAATHFAQAVTILGVSVVSALLLRKSATAVMGRAPKLRPLPNVGPVPASTALKITRPYALPGGALGETDWWGNIKIVRSQSITEQRATLYHEWVHRVLSPRFGPLRELRAQMRASGYWRSALLRYVEEAMAESYGQLRAYGFDAMLKGISFPIKGGYVTVSQLVTEGVAIGNILAGGAAFHVVVVEGSWQVMGAQ